jgi:KUP system potassium uptake protein
MNTRPVSASLAPSSSAPTAVLVLGAVGVVFGDIGTSPLYALKEAFSPHYGIPLTRANVLGILSVMAWSMMVAITLKYLVVMMRADNSGEGGILALLSLALREARGSDVLKWSLIALGIFGAAMFYGDSMITPAITVLSAMEGLGEFSPALEPWVVPLSLAVIAALFMIQRHGTARVGSWFGPIMLAWFALLAALGLANIAQDPGIVQALAPTHGVDFLRAHPAQGFFVLGAVFLAITGGEALYADMGHFGRRPIRVGWALIVFPSLLLNYLGQAACVLQDPSTIANPFYRMAPSWALLPAVVLATCASVIASQAVITGAFSVTRQAIQLGYIPRLVIRHTSERAIGQIYMPFVNWMLFLGVVALVLAFRNSSGLANAYGIAVSATMVIEGLLAMVVARLLWRWPWPLCIAVIGGFLVVDSIFLASNAAKFPDGGWLPVLAGAILFALLLTWKRGRSLMLDRLAEQGIPLKPFLESLEADLPARVPGTAIFMSATPDTVPHALLHNLKHNKVVHERTVFLTMVTHDVPYVPVEDRVQLERLVNGFHRIEAWYGFKEQPDIEEVFECSRTRYGLAFDMMDTSFFLSRDSVIPVSARRGPGKWRDHVFAWMTRNAERATDFFNIPANRVVELGTHIEI